jgi:hypothetical protein
MSFFSYLNHVDRAGVTFTPGSEVASMPSSHLAEPQLEKIWRTENDVETLTIDLGADRTVDVLALAFLRKNGLSALDLAPDLAATDTIQHRLRDVGNSIVWDSGVVNFGADPQLGYHVLDVKTLNGSSVASVRKWQIDITATSRAGDGYFDLSRAWAGEYTTPSANFTFGPNFTWQDASKISRAARHASEFIDKGALYRQWSMNYNSLKQVDADVIEQMERLIGISDQMLFCRDTSGDLHDETIFCRQNRATGYSQSNVGRFGKTLRLNETL